MAKTLFHFFFFNKLETFFPVRETAPEYYCKCEKLTLFLWSSLLEQRDFLTFKGEEKRAEIDHPTALCVPFIKLCSQNLVLSQMRPTLLLFKQGAFYTVERKCPLGWRNIPQGFIIMQDYQVGDVIKSVLWCQWPREEASFSDVGSYSALRNIWIFTWIFLEN